MKKIVISGGGTGGHIFPAIAIADQIKLKYPGCKILFVGARGRMEEEKVPLAGYEITLLPIRGLDRKKPWKNIQVAWRLFKSFSRVKKILEEMRPDAVVGVGGYASAPTLMAAQQLKIPTLIQEQNSYAGVTNKLLAKKAKAICVAYPDMDRFFPASSIHFTGNPLRENLLKPLPSKEDSALAFGLDPSKKTLLVLGGSLGARSINEGVMAGLSQLVQSEYVQVLWQTGKFYRAQVEESLATISHPAHIVATPFIREMEKAYALADVVVSRAGAASISELSALGKAAILVPSPNVAENHQWHNAMSLVRAGAALMVEDNETSSKLISTALELLEAEERCVALKEAIKPFGKREAAKDIVEILERLVQASSAS